MFAITICCIMGKYSKEPFTFVRQERKMKRNIMETNIISELTTFIEHAPTAFHAVAELKEILKQEGFEELKESVEDQTWEKILCNKK